MAREPSLPGKETIPIHPHYWPTVIIFRDWQPVARIGPPVIANEWELLINACSAA